MSQRRRADAQGPSGGSGFPRLPGRKPGAGLAKEGAHILPRNKEFWKTSANPPNSNVWLNHESDEFVRFINPGDLRVAKQACGLCHAEIVRNVEHTMMAPA